MSGRFKVWRNGTLEGAENSGYLSVLRPARQSYGAPAAPEENCYVETPCTRSCGDGFKAGEGAESNGQITCLYKCTIHELGHILTVHYTCMVRLLLISI